MLTQEANFGVTRFDGAPKPAYTAAATLRRVLGAAARVTRLNATSAAGNAESVFALRFASDGRGDAGSPGALVGMAVWQTLSPQPQALRVAVQEDGACFTGQSYLGQPLGRFRARRGELALANITDGPLLLTPAACVPEWWDGSVQRVQRSGGERQR